MAISNFNSVHLTEEQMNAINEALKELEKALEPLKTNLSPEDRKKYGRVNEQNKLFINKVHDFATSQPELRSPDVNWEEFFKDFKSRNFLEAVTTRLNSFSTRTSNAKTMHDYDNYQESLQDYSYTNFRVNAKNSNFEEKYKELKQFFAKNRKSTASKKENTKSLGSE